jgi:hypothetical protein
VRGNLIQIRVSDEEKARIGGRAAAAGSDSLSEYLRDLALGNVEPMISSTAISLPAEQKGASMPEPAPRTPPVVEAEIEEAQMEDEAAREAFIDRRAKALFGAGNTSRVARSMAEDEWRNRGS